MLILRLYIILSTVGVSLQEIQEVILFYNSPCQLLTLTQNKPSEGRFASTTSILNYLYDECGRQYDHWLDELSNVSSCSQYHPIKGTDDVVVKAVGAAATDFITTKFIPIDEIRITKDTGKEMLKEIKEESANVIMKAANEHSELINKMQQLSKSSVLHQGDVKEVSNFLPTIVMVSIDMYTRMLASIANYRAIVRMCRKGRLAVDELSELTGSPELGNLRPENTRLRSILVNKKESSVTFIFRVTFTDHERIDWFKHISMFSFVFVLGSVSTICVIGCYIMVKQKKIKEVVAAQVALEMEAERPYGDFSTYNE